LISGCYSSFFFAAERVFRVCALWYKFMITSNLSLTDSTFWHNVIHVSLFEREFRASCFTYISNESCCNLMQITQLHIKTTFCWIRWGTKKTQKKQIKQITSPKNQKQNNVFLHRLLYDYFFHAFFLQVLLILTKFVVAQRLLHYET